MFHQHPSASMKPQKWAEIFLLSVVFGCLLYMLCPWRIWGHFLFAGYTEVIYHSILILSPLLACMLCVRIFIQKETEFPLNVPDLLFTAIFIILFLSAAFSAVSPETTAGWMGCVLLYALIRSVKREHRTYLLYVFPTAVLFQLVYGIEVQTDYFMPGKGLELVSGTFSNTAIWAQFVCITFLVSAGMLMAHRSFVACLFWGACIFVSGLLLIIADSRAAWLSACAGVSFLLWQKFQSPLRKVCRKKMILIPIIIAATVLGIVAFQSLYHYKTDSANGRLLIWQVTGKMIQDRPISGFGPEGFRKNYMRYQGEYFKTQNRPAYKMLANNNPFAFNEFLNIGVEHGIPGICVAVVFLLSLFRKTDVAAPDKFTGSTTLARSCILSFMVFGFFSYPLSVWQLTIVFVFFTAFVASAYAPCIHLRKIKPTPFILVAAALILFYTFLHPYSKAFREWNRVLVADIPADSTLHTLDKVRPFLEQHPAFLLNYGIRLNRAGKYEEAVPVLSESCANHPTYQGYMEWGKSLEKTGRYHEAKEKWTQALQMIPHKFTPLYLQMRMNLSIGQQSKAHLLADSILRKEIKLYSPNLNKILRETKQIKQIKQK